MKTGIFTLSIFGIAMVHAVAIPAPKVVFSTSKNFCQNTGQGCLKLRRAVDAAAEAIDPPSQNVHAKRAALALAEAAANALNAYDPSADSCYATNANCHVAQSQAIDEDETGSEGLDKREPKKKSEYL